MSPRLTIQIVGWNSAQELPATVAALGDLPSDEVVIHYIDNASTDNSTTFVRERLPRAKITALEENRGFTGAHNHGLAECTTPFVLLHDPDVTIDWKPLQHLLDMFTDEKLAAVQGKLWRSRSGPSEKKVIDSAGITLTVALNGQERGANEIDEGQWDTPRDVFAVTGACALYRLAALQEIAYSSREVMDDSFFAYKDDVDLGWRLHRAGWRVAYSPVPIGSHHRTMGRRGLFNWGINPIVIWQRMRSPRTRYSFRNWCWMVVKNASLKQLLLAGPFVFVRLATFLALTVFYPPFLLVWFETIRGLPRAFQRRSF